MWRPILFHFDKEPKNHHRTDQGHQTFAKKGHNERKWILQLVGGYQQGNTKEEKE